MTSAEAVGAVLPTPSTATASSRARRFFIADSFRDACFRATFLGGDRSNAARSDDVALPPACSTIVDVARKRTFRALADIDPEKLASFQAGIRKRYSDEDLLAELTACAERLGHSPTMREFADDPQVTVHPQTVIEHFGSWNAAKRAAGLLPRRFATREELLGVLRELGEELGRTPTARDLEERRGRMPSKSLYWHTFGSLTTALREAGFDVPVGEERLERAVEQGVRLARKLKRLPKFADWAEARKADDTVLTEWQVYRMFDSRRGAWATFQFLISERLREQGVSVSAEGRVG